MLARLFLFISLLLASTLILAGDWQPVLQRPAVKAEGRVGLAAMQALRQDLETIYRVARHQGSANDRLYLEAMDSGLARQGLSWDEYYADTLQFVQMVAKNSASAHNRQAYKQEMRQLQDLQRKLRRYRKKSLQEILALPR